MLTELESCILGVIWREGPMSAYGVRAHFAGSATATWSSSTGTVYPAIRRLRGAGLLEAASPKGPRKSELLSLTDEGRAALERWLTDVSAELGASTADPIRTRVHFLTALSPQARMKALQDYRVATRAAIERLDASAAVPTTNPVDQSERLGTLGALAELKARLEWLEAVERELSSVA
jgi:DNA-binding PadR family transcriptional regulator